MEAVWEIGKNPSTDWKKVKAEDEGIGMRYTIVVYDKTHANRAQTLLASSILQII